MPPSPLPLWQGPLEYLAASQGRARRLPGAAHPCLRSPAQRVPASTPVLPWPCARPPAGAGA
jgi:hypothetical protein